MKQAIAQTVASLSLMKAIMDSPDVAVGGVYTGTVRKADKQKRRKAGKAARKARKTNR